MQKPVSSQQAMDWAALVSWRVITFSCWTLLLASDLHPLDDMRQGWFLSAVLSVLTFFFFFLALWENHWDHVNASGLRLKRSTSNRNNVRLAQAVILASNHKSFPLSCLVYCKSARMSSVDYSSSDILQEFWSDTGSSLAWHHEQRLKTKFKGNCYDSEERKLK